MNTKRTTLFALVIPLGVLSYVHALWCLGAALEGHLAGWLALVTVTVLVGLFPVKIPGTRSVISITDAFIFTSVLLFGVFPSVVLAGIDALISTRRMTRKLSSNLFSLSVMSFSIYVSARLFEWLIGRGDVSTPLPVERLVIPLAAMTLAHFLIDSGLVAAVTAFSRKQPIVRTWTDNFLWSSVTFFSGASAAAVIYIFAHSHGVATFGVVFPILLITYYTYKIYMEKVDEKNRHIREMSEVHLATIEALTMAIDAKDQITYGHVRRVRVYALALARLAGFNEDELEAIKAAALLHDIGKLAIPEYILNKPGKLTPHEYEKMKSHPVIGSDILSNVRFPYPVIPMVRHHHERWDGTGYPDGLKGEAIPPGARVLAIADCFDAMRSSRPYHRAVTRAEAVAYLQEDRGKHFDPRLVDAFVAQIDAIAAEADSLLPASGPFSLRENASPATVPRSSQEAHSVLDSISSAHREALALYEMARVIGRSLSLTETMDCILEKLGEFLPYTTAVLYLQEDAGNEALVRAARGRHQDQLAGMAVRLGEGATGWCIKHNRGLYNFDPAMDLAGVARLDGTIYKCAATFPLAVSDRVLGALTFYSDVSNQYSVEHERVMEIVTHQASMALLNAVIYEQTRASALTDALTGLHNSRYLEHAYERRVNRGERELALLVIDLDGFKSVNDRYGHAAGDRLLKEAAQVMHGALRADDVLARVGGDEFVVLAGDCGSAQALESVIERLRGRFEAHEFCARQGEPIFLGLSIGHGCLEQDGTSLDELRAVADRRMYEEKAGRRRRTGLRSVSGGLSRRTSGEVVLKV